MLKGPGTMSWAMAEEVRAAGFPAEWLEKTIARDRHIAERDEKIAFLEATIRRRDETIRRLVLSATNAASTATALAAAGNKPVVVLEEDSPAVLIELRGREDRLA